jgi:hypothetical protein
MIDDATTTPGPAQLLAETLRHHGFAPAALSRLRVLSVHASVVSVQHGLIAEIDESAARLIAAEHPPLPAYRLLIPRYAGLEVEQLVSLLDFHVRAILTQREKV